MELGQNLGRKDIGLEQTRKLLSVLDKKGVVSEPNNVHGFLLNADVALDDRTFPGDLARWYGLVALRVGRLRGRYPDKVAVIAPAPRYGTMELGLGRIAGEITSEADLPNIVIGLGPNVLGADSVVMPTHADLDKSLYEAHVVIASWQVLSGGHIAKVAKKLRDYDAIAEDLIAFATTEEGIKQASEAKITTHSFLTLPEDIEAYRIYSRYL